MKKIAQNLIFQFLKQNINLEELNNCLLEINPYEINNEKHVEYEIIVNNFFKYDYLDNKNNFSINKYSEMTDSIFNL